LATFYFVSKKLDFIPIKNVAFSIGIFNARAVVHGTGRVAFAIVLGFSKARW